MIADGERLKAMMKGTERCALLCAPFVKVGALGAVLSVIGEAVSVRIVTRWRATEVAAGISDLEVFELSNERPNTELALLDDLHAKLYLADDEGLAGSANVTAAALGWAQKSNVELLLPVRRSDSDVVRLLRRLERAEPATYAIRSAVEAEAVTLGITPLDEGQGVSIYMENVSKHAWLPRCAAPGNLWAIYEDPRTTVVVEGTREDGLADFRDLHIPSGLSLAEFEEAVRDTLLLMPAFKRVIDHIPQGLADSAGIALVSEAWPDLTESNRALQWRIVRDWISEFFSDEFEVAPESFVTRLKPRR